MHLQIKPYEKVLFNKLNVLACFPVLFLMHFTVIKSILQNFCLR